MAKLAGASAAEYRERLAEDEIIYFVLPDRFENGDPSNDNGGLSGDRETATAQAVAECLRRNHVRTVRSDRTLALSYVEAVRHAA